MKLISDGTVLVFLSDESVFEYQPNMRLWRQTLLKDSNNLTNQLKSQQVSGISLYSNGGYQNHPPRMPHQLRDLSSVIQQLEAQSLQEQQAINQNGGDVDMMNVDTTSATLKQSQARSMYEDVQSLHVRVNELMESLQMYERLHMRNEFLYTMRMYTLALLQIGDMLRLKELLTDYKFMLTWEDERALEFSAKISNTSQPNKASGINAESAYGNLMALVNQAQMQGNDDGKNGDGAMEQVEGTGKRGGTGSVIEKPLQLICGGLEKKIVFQ